MLFRVFVPGFGDFFVQANEQPTAVAAVQQFLVRNGIPVGEAGALGEAIPVTRDQVAGDLILNAEGEPVGITPQIEDGSDGGSALTRVPRPSVSSADIPSDLPGEPGEAGAENLPATIERASISPLDTSQTAAANFTVVGKIVTADGSIEFVRVNASGSSEARSVLETVFGPSAQIQIVSTPEFLLENDADFLDFLQGSGLPDLESFVSSLELVSRPITDDQPGTDDEIDLGADSVLELPIDVQSFPFASFQNAVAGLGLDPEGVLGSTVSQRFNALAPAAQIGSLTGTIDPIGQDPGALEQFFSDRFGDLDLAAETFRDLLAGRTGSDLSTDQLLSFQALQNPDIATSRGRGNAANVFRLARAAAEDRFGPFVASRLLPSNARLFRELERVLAEGDPSTDFLEFARQQNLLPV